MGLATQGADEAFSHTKRPDLTTININIVFIYGLQPMVIVGDTPEKKFICKPASSRWGGTLWPLQRVLRINP